MDVLSENAAFKRWRNKMELENNNVLPNFLITAASTQGGRRYMEDRVQIEIGRKTDGQLDFVYAAVYDGHGGTQASEYVQQHLFNNIVNNPSFTSEDDHLVLEAIREGFLKTHSDMRQEAMQWPPTVSGFPCTAGTTATCAFIRNGKLYTGHVGDSSIVLANFVETDAGYKDAKLTDDHKPEITSERQRIERAGGAVAMKSGIFRVIWKRPLRGHRGPVRRSTATENIPFLAVARSLGDFWSLNPISNEYVVSPEPDVDVFELKDSDNFVVIATDGLTTVVGVRTIIEALREIEKRSQLLNNNCNEPSMDGSNYEGLIDFDEEFDTDLPLNHAHCLLQYAFKRWSTLRADNISIICLKLNANEMPTDQSVLVADQNLNVGEAMTDHPLAMLRVTNNDTQLLRTNPIRLRYFGTTDKNTKHSAQNRFVAAAAAALDNSSALIVCHNGEGTDDNATNIVRRKSQKYLQNATAADQNGNGSFKGPGFVHPEHLGNIENNGKNIDDEAVGSKTSRSSLDSEAVGVIVAEVDDLVTTMAPPESAVVVGACESDVEEVKELSEVELALSTTSSLSSDTEPDEQPQEQHTADGDGICRPKSQTLQNLDSVKALATAVNGACSTTKGKMKAKWKSATTPAPAKPPSSPTAPRHSLKRRLRDEEEDNDNDEHGPNKNLGTYGQYLQQQYNARRHRFDECASTTTSSTRVSLEGDDYYVGTMPKAAVSKPPPAKRSRIQNVVHFFTSLFGFRWPG